MLRVCVLILSLALLADHSSAQEVGEWILTVRDADVKAGEEIIGVIQKGRLLTVVEINGGWIKVSTPPNAIEPTIPGAVRAVDTVPLALALGVFNTELAQVRSSTGCSARAMVYATLGKFDLAIADCDHAIKADARNVYAYEVRGYAYAEKGKQDKAIEDYDAAIRFNPRNPITFVNRGNAWSALEQFDKAMRDYDEAIQLDPQQTRAYHSRGLVWKKRKQYEKAVQDYDTALRLDPMFTRALNSYAWLAATCDDAAFRDGLKAVECATRACELSKTPVANYFDTLAAAQAESGDFQSALTTQAQAIKHATSEQLEAYRVRLELYKTGQAYRDR